ncbi:hypothetical protein Peur_074106 [Populus x canadensis]
MDVLSLKTQSEDPSLVPEQTNIKTDRKRNWNAIMKSHAKLKNDHAILSKDTQMESLGIAQDKTTLPLIFQACTRLNAVERGKKIRSGIEGANLIEDVRVGTALVVFCCKCGAMISGFELNSRTLVALLLACEGVLELRLRNELECNDYRIFCFRGFGESFGAFCSDARGWAYAEFGYLELGMQINQMAIKFSYNNDLFIVNALLNMYDEIGSSVLARKLFDITTVRDAVLWNSMICAYIEHGFYEAIDVFNRMQEEISLDERTIVALLSLDDGLKRGKSLHAHSFKSEMRMDVSVENAFLSMYTDLNCVEAAQKVFDLISWNAMVASYIKINQTIEALSFFNRMGSEVEPNLIIIINVFSTYTDLTNLP